MIFRKLLKYELMNLLRNRWIFVMAALIGAISVGFIQLAGDFSKAALSLSSVLGALIPLLSSVFAAVYWYYSDRFTELLLTQPIRRQSLLAARWLAMSGSFVLALAVGILVPFLGFGGIDLGVILVFGTSAFLSVIFITLGILIAIRVSDRMKGIGGVLGTWLYFVVIHDGLILLLLLALREYPLDTVASILGAMNPIGLARVLHLVHYDASLLLSYSGAMVRHLIEGWAGIAVACGAWALWLVLPLVAARRSFVRKDF